MSAAFEIARLAAIVALLCAAGALATPKGRLPLALRGVAKLFRISGDERSVPPGKRALALALVLLAVLLALV